MERRHFMRESNHRAVSVLRVHMLDADGEYGSGQAEAADIIATDGSPEKLVAGLLNVSMYLLVQFEKRGHDVFRILDHIEGMDLPDHGKPSGHA